MAFLSYHDWISLAISISRDNKEVEDGSCLKKMS